MKNTAANKGTRKTAAAARRNEKMQQVNLCIQTYFNLYGHMPSLKEMIEWLGNGYRPMVAAALQVACV